MQLPLCDPLRHPNLIGGFSQANSTRILWNFLNATQISANNTFNGAMLAPNAEVSMFPWKEPKERIPVAVRQIRSFLRAHRPASA